MRAGPLKVPMERVEYPFWRRRCPGLTEIVIGWDRIWFA
jgi:hypothetical protein